MKRMSRDTRTSRLLVLLMCALLLAGMLPTFGALGDAKNGTGRLTIFLQTKVKDLPEDAKVTYTLYKIGSAAPASSIGWEFDASLAEHTREILGIIEAKSNSDMQTAVDKLAAVVTDNYKVETLDLSKGSATTSELGFGVYLGVLTDAPKGMTASASLFTIPAWNAGKTELLYDQSATVKDVYLGDLTISKTVISPETADHAKSFSFTVTLTKGGELYKTNESFKTNETVGGKTTAGADVTFKDGQATVKVKGDTSVTILDLPQGVGYTVNEATSADFHTTASGETDTIGEKVQTAAFTNIRTGEKDVYDVATITKVDEEDKPLKGATFALYSDKDLSKEITTYTANPFEIRTNDEALADYLPVVGGSKTLYLVETVAPQGYKLEKALHEVTLTASKGKPIVENDQYITPTIYAITIDKASKRLNVPNQPITEKVTKHDYVRVTKTGIEGSLNGAIFTLFNDDEPIKKFGSAEESGFYISTNDKDLADLLPLSDDETVILTLKETTAPTGYKLPKNKEYSVIIERETTTDWNTAKTKLITTTAYSITIDDEDSLDVPNEPVTEEEDSFNSIVVNKVNNNNRPLNGAVFTLYNGNTAIATYGGANINSFTISTDDNALKKYLPEEGKTVTLTLKETRAPSGYVLADDEYKVVLTATNYKRWNDDHTKLLTGLNYGITIDNLRSVTVENEPVSTTTPPTGGGGGGGGGAPVPPGPTPTPTTDITITKVWVDNGNFNDVRPGSIDIRLLADGREVDATPTVSKSGDRWTYTYTNLPKFDNSGDEITYTAQEVQDVNDEKYYTKSESDLTVTNTLKKLPPEKHIDLYVKKTWVDDDNLDGKRPTYITVYLYRDGEIIEKVTITAATNWEYSFKNLDADNGYGHEYTYTIKEETVPGYYTRINGTDITNGLLPPGGDIPNVPGEPVEEIPQRGGTPGPRFEELTDEELEDLFDMFGYGTPLYGMFGTGDQIPAWVWVCGALGILALTMAIVMGRKKSKSR